MNRLYGAAFSFFVFAILIYAVVEWHQSKQPTLTDLDNDIAPDFIAETLSSDIYNKEGKLAYNIDAKRMEHFADYEVTHFDQPKYTLYPKGGEAPWKVSAIDGTLYSNNLVKLENRVTLMSTDASSLVREIHGSYLELNLRTNVLSSEQAIMIIGNGFTIYGSGLVVDLNTTQMTLNEHVQTIYKKSNS
ncbi:LPS export ABC transporter periplasmic protein LptC [Thalassotalea fusca]